MSTNPSTECTYTFLPVGIHQLTLHTVSATAMDAYFAHLDAIFRQTPPHQTIRSITIFEQPDMPPIDKVWSLSQKLVKTLSADRPLRSAILYPQKALPAPYNAIFNILVALFAAKVRMFTLDESLAAAEWLFEA